jgi:hypothetical protein
MKGNTLTEVWITDKYLYLSSDSFLNFIKDLLMGRVSFKLELF